MKSLACQQGPVVSSAIAVIVATPLGAFVPIVYPSSSPARRSSDLSIVRTDSVWLPSVRVTSAVNVLAVVFAVALTQVVPSAVTWIVSDAVKIGRAHV